MYPTELLNNWHPQSWPCNLIQRYLEPCPELANSLHELFASADYDGYQRLHQVAVLCNYYSTVTLSI